MRISCLLLIIGLHVSANSLSQKITISARNIPLEKLFSMIEKQTAYRFFYVDGILSNARSVTVEAKDMTVEDVLTTALTPLGLFFRIEKQTISVYKKPGVAENPLNHAIAQLADIHGRVVDENGSPVPGVTVSIKGTKKSVSTDDDGQFTLNTTTPKATLVFSSVNMENFELKVNGQSELSVALKTKMTQLGVVAVEVNTGYQRISKERAIGSYTKIDSALFNRQPSTDLLSRLDGIANSLLFDKRSSETRLQIRGISTLQGDSQPLIVLDNFEYYGDINNINPNEVEDITILKDAAAASVWGAKAANGVIVITTKKGKYNRPLHTSYNYYIGIQEKPNLYYNPQMSTSDYIDVEQLLFNNGFYDANLTNNTNRPIVSPVVEVLNRQRNGNISAADAATQINSLRNLDVRQQYNKYLLRAGVSQQHNLAFTGGTNQIKYKFSFGYDHNIDQYKGPGGFTRYAINSLISYKPLKSLELTAGINSVQSSSRTGGSEVFTNEIYPYAQLADATGNHLALPLNYRVSFVDTAGNGKLLDWHFRPLDELALVDSKITGRFYQLNFAANLRITSWLNADLKYQNIQQTNSTRDLHSKETYFSRNLINKYTDPATYTKNIPLGGILDMSSNELVGNNLRGQLNFNKTWDGKHEINALAAGEIGESRASSSSNRIYGYDDDILALAGNVNYNTFLPLYLGGTGQIPNNLGLDRFVTRSVSALANISYNYDARYTFYASARKDGSNIFGVKTNNRFKPLWSAGGGWNVSKERFYHSDWLTSLRLRASYGYTGNTNNTIPGLATILYRQNLSPYTGTPMAGIISTPNPNLRWEETRIVNLGIDFGLLKDRLSGNLEGFNKRSRDVIADFPLDPTTGANTATRNVANLKTSGLDIQLTSYNIKMPFQWNTVFNLSYARTVVTKYYQAYYTAPVGEGGINPEQGQIAYGYYSYRWGGLDPVTGDPQGYLGKQLSKDYTAIINDSLKNQVFNGSSVPLYFGNMLNSFSWKRFSLSANITFRFNYYFRKPALVYSTLFGGEPSTPDYKMRWQKPGDEKFTTVPSLIYPDNSDRDKFYQYASVNIEKADNIRLGDLRLSYNLNGNSLSHSPFSSLQIFLYSNNLNIILWKAAKSPVDPDYSGDLFNRPPSRSWAAGINVGFK